MKAGEIGWIEKPVEFSVIAVIHASWPKRRRKQLQSTSFVPLIASPALKVFVGGGVGYNKMN